MSFINCFLHSESNKTHKDLTMVLEINCSTTSIDAIINFRGGF